MVRLHGIESFRLFPFEQLKIDYPLAFFEFQGVAFSLLAMDVTLAYWKSIYFIGHAIIPLVYIGNMLIPSVKPAKKAE